MAALAATMGVAGLSSTAHAATTKATPTSTSTAKQPNATKTNQKDDQDDVKPATVVKTTDLSDEPMPYHMKSGYIYSDSGLTKTLGSAKDFANVTFYAYKKKSQSTARLRAVVIPFSIMLEVAAVNKPVMCGMAILRVSRKELLISQWKTAIILNQTKSLRWATRLLVVMTVTKH